MVILTPITINNHFNNANYDTILSANGIPETVIESVKYCIEKRIRIEFKKEISDYCEYEGKKNDVKSTNYIAAIVILIISNFCVKLH